MASVCGPDGEPGEVHKTNAPDEVFEVAVDFAGHHNGGDPERDGDHPLNRNHPVCSGQQHIEQELLHRGVSW